MSRAVAFKGCMDTGHDCFPPRKSIEGSSDVYVNNIPVHKQGDKWAVHVCGDSAHDGSLAEGSDSVFVNGKPMGRIGDSVNCGSAVAEGSEDTFAG